jgi:predicted HicB family RNase H-like nuclease
MPEGAPRSEAPTQSQAAPSEAAPKPEFQSILRAAETLFAGQPGWNEFHAQILGVAGMAPTLFPTPETMAEFQQSEEFSQIQMMLAELRVKSKPSPKLEPTRMITVRLPARLHEALKDEARHRATSVNKLCIAKLVRAIEDHELEGQEEAVSNLPRRALQKRKSRRASSDG